MTDRSEPTGRAEPTTEVATSASIGDAELDKRLEPSLVAVVARSGLTSHDYTAGMREAMTAYGPAQVGVLTRSRESATPRGAADDHQPVNQ